MNRRTVLLGLSLLLAGCDALDPFKTDVADFRNADYRKVNAASAVLKAPSTAASINYFQRHFQDTTEFIHFRDSRASVDSFAKAFLGAVPIEAQRKTPRSRDPEIAWWPTGPVTGARYGYRNDGKSGIREVLIRDHEGYSEVWASWDSWVSPA